MVYDHLRKLAADVLPYKRTLLIASLIKETLTIRTLDGGGWSGVSRSEAAPPEAGAA